MTGWDQPFWQVMGMGKGRGFTLQGFTLQGFTLIEVLVTLVVAAMILVPLMQVFYVNRAMTARVRAGDKALFLVQGKMEELKSLNFNGLNDEERVPFEGEPGYFYAVSIFRENDHLKRIDVTVYYQSQAGLSGAEKQLMLTGYRGRWVGSNVDRR